MSSLLMSGRFVAAFPSLVRALGGNTTVALVLQAIHYRSMDVAEPDDDGYLWIELPLQKIADDIGISVDQVKRAATALRDSDLIKSQGSTGRGNHLAWRVDHEALDALTRKGADPHPLERVRNRTKVGADPHQPWCDSAPTSTPSIGSKNLEEEVEVTAAQARPTRRQGTRIPTSWKPSHDDLAFAAGQGVPHHKVGNEAAQFHDYWLAKPGKDGTKLDWAATWRTWIRRNYPDQPAPSLADWDREAERLNREQAHRRGR